MSGVGKLYTYTVVIEMHHKAGANDTYGMVELVSTAIREACCWLGVEDAGEDGTGHWEGEALSAHVLGELIANQKPEFHTAGTCVACGDHEPRCRPDDAGELVCAHCWTVWTA